MYKALLSRFNDTELLFGGVSHSNFEGLLSGLASHELIDKAMASTDHNEEFWGFDPDSWKSIVRPYKVQGGILYIPVRGVLLHNFPYQFFDYATGYEYIWQAYRRGMSDPEVKAIALLVHSGGGEVAGCFDAVDKMFTLKGTKPVRAFAHEYAFSAAYAVASVADHIAMSRTGGVGSIGVVTSHVDVSKMMDDLGWKVTFVHAGKHKVDGNPYGPLPDDVKARWQTRVEKLREIFVATVARNRSMDAQELRNTEALTYDDPEAISVGLADSVGALDDAVAAFAADLSKEEGDEKMSDEKDKAAVNQAALDEARAAGVAEGMAAGKKEGMEAGAKAERERIGSIVTCAEAEGREAAAIELALDEETTFSATSAAKVLSRMPKSESTPEGEDEEASSRAMENQFSEAMRNGAPEVGDEGADERTDVSDAEFARQFGIAGF